MSRVSILACEGLPGDILDVKCVLAARRCSFLVLFGDRVCLFVFLQTACREGKNISNRLTRRVAGARSRESSFCGL